MDYCDSVTRQVMVTDFFSPGIVNDRKLRSVAKTLQEGRFTRVRPADHEDSEVIYAIEILFDFRRIDLDLFRRTLCDRVTGIRTCLQPSL